MSWTRKGGTEVHLKQLLKDKIPIYLLKLPQTLFSWLRIPCRTSETRTDTCGQSTLCRFASVHLENVLVTTNLDEEKQLQHAGRFYLASKFLGVLSSWRQDFSWTFYLLQRPNLETMGLKIEIWSEPWDHTNLWQGTSSILILIPLSRSHLSPSSL